jgi:hypothetical protein
MAGAGRARAEPPTPLTLPDELLELELLLSEPLLLEWEPLLELPPQLPPWEPRAPVSATRAIPKTAMART